MDFERNKYETPKDQMEGEPSSAEAYGQTEQAVSNVYKKTTPAVNEIFEKVKSYRAKIRANQF